MAELKTKLTDKSVSDFISSIGDPSRQKECKAILKIMKEVTGKQPKMWGDSIVGFGEYRYKYATGREGDWFLVGFSPRKQNLTLYFMGGLSMQTELLKKLGKHKTGKGCLYINRLEEIDLAVLKKMIVNSVAALTKNAK
jgi:hypothetical protein